MITLRVAASAAVLMLGIAVGSASALPKFAQRENKACAHCHIKRTGGGKRNPVGHWYEEHSFSFKSLTPAKLKALQAKKSKPVPKKKVPGKTDGSSKKTGSKTR